MASPPSAPRDARLPWDDTHLLGRLVGRGPDRAGRLRHVRHLPERPGTTVDWPEWADPQVVEAFRAVGVGQPWAHQVTAASLARGGQHVVLSTGTASGKSLAYQLPTLTAVLESRRGRRRGATAVYLSPTKALAHDQLASLSRLDLPRLAACTVDGDGTPEQRQWARDHAEYVLTNPDLLHHSLLPGHRRWAGFLSRLQYVVVDECHQYRGVFGAHVALVLRRLRRICALHGADPVFVLASATVTDPGAAAASLTGLPCVAVTQDDSPRGPVTLALWEPERDEATGRRPTAAQEAADLLGDLVAEQVQTLAFVPSRRAAEVTALAAARRLARTGGGTGLVAAYRGGLNPEDRRDLERALRERRLLGMATTNALEMGVDVRGLDAVVVAGYPGSRASFWQQVGRAGREQEPSLGLLVANDDPLDAYLVAHPETLLDSPVEGTALDPGNPYVVGPHLCAAADEAPLTADDLALLGESAAAGVTALAASGMLRRRGEQWFWTGEGRPADLADLRSAGGRPVSVVDPTTGRVVGTVDGASAPALVHPGAVHLVQGEAWVVDALDLDAAVAEVHAEDPGWTTVARGSTDLVVLGEDTAQQWGEVRVVLGEVEVARQVVAFTRRDTVTGTLLGEEPLDLPASHLRTTAVWWSVPEPVWTGAGLTRRAVAGAVHAAEHACVGLLPLVAGCDRGDLGALSAVTHPSTGALTVFAYDAHAGGAGYAEQGFARALTWLTAARDAVRDCDCAEGCPSCVQSPRCGSHNHPLDKQGAVVLLDLLLRGAPGPSPGPARGDRPEPGPTPASTGPMP